LHGFFDFAKLARALHLFPYHSGSELE